MNQSIVEVKLYVYLGIILTHDLDFKKHIDVTLQSAHKQGREALLLGVRRGELHPRRARLVWGAYIEPKFGYGIGMWLAGSDSVAMRTIDRIQCIGAQLLMGVSVPSDWTVRPPNVSILLESGLAPACVMRVKGLLRLWRVARTREPNSLLGMAWSIGEDFRHMFGRESINNAVAEVHRKYYAPKVWPEPELKTTWKVEIDLVGETVFSDWYRREVSGAAMGRRVAYRHRTTYTRCRTSR
jgi:hypothetical protein